MAKLLQLSTYKVEDQSRNITLPKELMIRFLDNNYLALVNNKGKLIAQYTSIDNDSVNGVDEVEDLNGTVYPITNISQLYTALKLIF